MLYSSSFLVGCIALSLIVSSRSDESAPVNCQDWREELDDLASSLMVASFKESVPPTSLQDYNETFCEYQLTALTNASLLGENCPSPSQVKFYKLYKAGIDSHLFMACKDFDGTRDTFDAYKTFTPAAWKELHQLFDDFILHVETIRDNVSDNDIKMPLACCAFNAYLDRFEKVFAYKLGDTLTLNDVVVDFVYDSSETMKIPLNAVCTGYYERDNYRCDPLTLAHPVNISSSAKPQSKSILIPLMDIVLQAALLKQDD